MAKDNPISIWVGNLRKYNEGDLDGKWLDLPMADEQLKEALDEISLKGRDELMIFDKETREDSLYMHDLIHEFDDIHELNVVAKLIGNIPHPAVEMYLKHDENLSLSELANLIFKEQEINYSPYEFDGVDNPNVLNVLSNEEKLGYTILESNKSLTATLEGLDIDGTSILNYINVEAIGRDMVLSGYVTVGEEGFLDHRYITIDLQEYSIDEINTEINRDSVSEPQEKINFYEMLEKIENKELIRDFSDAQIYQVYLGEQNGLAREQIEIYARTEFNSERMSDIRESLEKGYSVELVQLLSNPELDSTQAKVVKRSLESGLTSEQIKSIARPELDFAKMNMMKAGFERVNNSKTNNPSILHKQNEPSPTGPKL